MIRFATILLCSALATCLIAQSPIQVADGFKVTKVADDQLATNIYTLTVDSNGHTVVAGPGYIKRLLDNDEDGIYDDFQLVSEFPKNGAQGLCFDGSTLYAVGDQGVLQLNDADNDGVCDPPKVALSIKTGGEHDAHALRKGPNDHWYLLCGNGVPMPEAYSQPSTIAPNRFGNNESGFLLELEKDFSIIEIVSYGFRNPYDFDFNSDADLFTFDSDGERDISLPWYQPTRVFRLSSHSNAGWVSPSWKHPDYFNSMPKTIGRHGRGSPTGVVCYRHDQFPKSFFDAIFVLDWTFGRMLVHKRDPNTGQYDQGVVFASPSGSAAFAVTDAEVAPDGSLLVSVGGRGTEGAVYRIESLETDPRFLPKHFGQINSSWARKQRRAEPIPNSSWPETVNLINDSRSSFIEKSVAIELSLQKADLPLQLFAQVNSSDPRLIKKLIWALKKPSGNVGEEQRHAIKVGAKKLQFGPGIIDLLDSIGMAVPFKSFAVLGDYGAHLRASSLTWDQTIETMASRFYTSLFWNSHTRREKDNRWPAVFDGYFSDDNNVVEKYPLEGNLHQIYNAMKVSRGITFYEWARRLAITRLTSPEIENLILDHVTDNSDPIDDIHFMICLTRCMKAPKTPALRRLIDALMLVRQKIDDRELNTDRNWPIRMRELVQTMSREFKAAEMIADHPEIAVPANFYLIDALPKVQQELARMRIANFAMLDPENVSSEQIAFLAAAESNIFCGLIRAYSNEPELTDAVISSLARSPIQEDRETFLRGFKSVNRRTWRLAAIGLRKLRSTHPEDAILIYNRAASLGSDKPDQRVGSELRRFLTERYRNESNEVTDYDLNQWREFLKAKHPEEFASTVAQSDSVSKSLKRLESIDLTHGDAENGARLFKRLQCHQCHDGGSRLGPSLKGLSNRFSDQDIGKAIVDPDSQIPDRYRAQKILTVDGELFFGSIVYESADGLVMTDRENKTLRIDQGDIESRASTNTSLMPSGLLDDISDEEVADLFGYMKSLK